MPRRAQSAKDFTPRCPKNCMEVAASLALLTASFGTISRAQVFPNPGSHIATSTWQLDMYIVKTMRKLNVLFRGRRTLQFLSTLVSHHQAVLRLSWRVLQVQTFFFGQWYVFPLTVGFIHAHAGQLLDPIVGIHPIQPYESHLIPLMPVLPCIKKMVVFHSHVISQFYRGKKKGRPQVTSHPRPNLFHQTPDIQIFQGPLHALQCHAFLLFLCQEISMYPKKHGSTIWKLNNEVTQAWSMSYIRPNSYAAGSCGLTHAVSAFSVDAMH